MSSEELLSCGLVALWVMQVPRFGLKKVISAVSVLIICLCNAKPVDCFSKSGSYLTRNAAAMDIT